MMKRTMDAATKKPTMGAARTRTAVPVARPRSAARAAIWATVPPWKGYGPWMLLRPRNVDSLRVSPRVEEYPPHYLESSPGNA